MWTCWMRYTVQARAIVEKRVAQGIKGGLALLKFATQCGSVSDKQEDTVPQWFSRHKLCKVSNFVRQLSIENY